MLQFCCFSECIDIPMFNEMLCSNMLGLLVPRLKVRILTGSAVFWTSVTTFAGTIRAHEAFVFQSVVPRGTMIVVTAPPSHVQGSVSSTVAQMLVIGSPVAIVASRFVLLQLSIGNAMHTRYRTRQHSLIHIHTTPLVKGSGTACFQHDESCLRKKEEEEDEE